MQAIKTFGLTKYYGRSRGVINLDLSVEEGDMFVAVKGTQTDGHAYIEKAIEKGAIAIVLKY